jgi:hypothetical protein
MSTPTAVTSCTRALTSNERNFAMTAENNLPIETPIRKKKGRPPHGLVGHPIHTSWKCMHRRCYYKNGEKYPIYGGRGITVCERWHRFTNFRDDMIQTWFAGGTLERVDNGGNYEPSNVKWATVKEQSSNRRSNVILEYKGEKKTMLQWSIELGLIYTSLKSRIRAGWPVEKALTEPMGPNRRWK